jgi:hydrogenase expression/formation protein HypE
MSRILQLGKPGSKFMRDVVFSKLGAHRQEVLVGPRFGVDNSVVDVGKGKVLVVTVDPLTYIPEIGSHESAWLSVHLLASDLTTSGFSPQYGVFDFNLPPRMSDSEFSAYWDAFHKECQKIGLAIVGGHTGRYEGCNYTIVGGGAMYATGSANRFLTSAMAQNGDDVILTKGAAVETTAVLARVFPKAVKKALGQKLFEKTWRYIRLVSTVNDALTAASVGVREDGVTAMHDATEGGILAAAIELANASRLGAELDLNEVFIPEETGKICKLFRIPPLSALSEGSLIIASRPSRSGKVLNKLQSAGVRADVIGELTSKTRHVYGTAKRKRTRLEYPKSDPYWRAYWHAIRKGWH